EIGTDNSVVSWNCSDQNPAIYKLFIDGNVVDLDSWESDLSIDFNFLEPGNYRGYMQICDLAGNIVGDSFRIIVTDTTSPIWDEEPQDQFIEYNMPFIYKLNATDNHRVAFYNISDKDNFAINSNGKITNISALVPGEYELTITATDPSGNIVQATFTVTMQGSENLDFVLTIIITTASFSGVGAIVFVLYRKKIGPFAPGAEAIVEPPNPDVLPEPDELPEPENIGSE
ncbi:MAG: chitinase N-terminal domain-containing protein, partial [Candidatus Thorarchaeota archaeon]